MLFNDLCAIFAEVTLTPNPFQRPRLKLLDDRLVQHGRIYNQQRKLQPHAVLLWVPRLRDRGVLQGSGSRQRCHQLGLLYVSHLTERRRSGVGAYV